MKIEIWWLWMLAGAGFVVAEVFTPGFFLFWFGVGSGSAAILAWAGVPAVWQWLGFIVVSGALVIVSKKFAEKFTKQQPAGVGADRMIEKEGIVIEEINNFKGTGLIMVDKEEWQARSETDEIIPSGQKVKVVKMEGVHLIVKKFTTC